MRLFTAIHLSDEIRANLGAMQERLKPSGADVKWVEPENFHLTVLFLGDLDNSLLPDIEAACESAFAGGEAFRIRVHGASYFPRKGPQIKTLWAGVTEGAEPWKGLVRRAEEWLTPFGAAKSNELVPHLTLGRVKGAANLDALRAAVQAEAETECGSQQASEVALVQSTLSPSGATYKTLRTWPLI